MAEYEARIDVSHSNQPQGVGRIVAVLIQFQEEKIVFLGIGIDYRVGVGDLDVGDARSTFDPKKSLDPRFVLMQFRRKFPEKINTEGALVIVDFDIIETVPAFPSPDGIAAFILLTAEAHVF